MCKSHKIIEFISYNSINKSMIFDLSKALIMKNRNQVVREMADLLEMFRSNYINKCDAIKFLRESFPGTSLTLRVNAYELVYESH